MLYTFRMELREYKSNNNVVYSSKYHVVWTPKYRRSVLEGKVAFRLRHLLVESCIRLKAEIIALEIMPDHVHLLVEVDPQFGRTFREGGDVKTFRYKLDPNRKQRLLMENTLNVCRELYNMGLEQRRGQRISQYDQEKQLTQLKAVFPEYKNVHAHVLQNVFARLNLSFENFFRRLKEGTGKAGFPRFKGKDRYDSFNFKNTGFSLNGKILSLSKIGNVKVRLSRPLPDDVVVKTCSIKKTVNGWFASIVVVEPFSPLSKNEDAVGIDVGISNFAALSDDTFVENPRFYQSAQAELRRIQRRVARRKKGSNRRRKAVVLLQKVHQRIVNRRLDFLHKESTKLVQKYGVIVVEDLNVSAMSRSNLSKQILDASWTTFINLIAYKAVDAGRQLLRVNPAYTSQTCPACQHVSRENRKTQSEFLCVECGYSAHADTNGAVNILARAEPSFVNADAVMFA